MTGTGQPSSPAHVQVEIQSKGTRRPLQTRAERVRRRRLCQGSCEGPFLTKRREEGRSETWATPTDTDLQRENDSASRVQGETAASGEVLPRTETLSLITERCISKVTAQRTKTQSNLTVVKRQTAEKTSPESKAEPRPATAGHPADREGGPGERRSAWAGLHVPTKHKGSRRGDTQVNGQDCDCTRVHRED